ncbi:MAG: DUF370 domain-containing protein [Oscillospiraceae bacterium]|nr:DUF370 domain-containing protein [Oscillospiraceae bacterium]
MYLHIGNNRLVKNSEILGIFDLDSATVSAVTRKYLGRADKEGRVVNIGGEIPKSFVLTETKIYMTYISGGTLLKRSERIELI